MKKSTKLIVLTIIILLAVITLAIFITKHNTTPTTNTNNLESETDQNINDADKNDTTMVFNTDTQSFTVAYKAPKETNNVPIFNDFTQIKSDDTGLIVYKNNQNNSGSSLQYFVYAEDKTVLFKYLAQGNDILDTARDKNTNYVYKNNSMVMYYPITETIQVHDYNAIPFHTLSHNPEYEYSLEEEYPEDIFCVIDLNQVGLKGYLLYYGIDNFLSLDYCQILNNSEVFQITPIN